MFFTAVYVTLVQKLTVDFATNLNGCKKLKSLFEKNFTQFFAISTVSSL